MVRPEAVMYDDGCLQAYSQFNLSMKKPEYGRDIGLVLKWTIYSMMQ